MCTAPIGLVDTSSVPASVGDGTPASCTESALRTAIASHGVVTFNCGASPVTIPITQTLQVPALRDTVIDGGGKVTLDGGNAVRIMQIYNPNYRSNPLGLTLQRLRMVNGKAPGTGYLAQDPSNPSCAYGYKGGSGAAVEVIDARLHVIDVEFVNNQAATPGPDVGGGAIYAAGSLNVTVVGSRFTGNSGSNDGAIGMLQTDGGIFNSLFQGNSATGTGQNFATAEVASCPGLGHAGQGGAGGNGGAVGVDGSDNADVTICGSRFIDNRANELAGAFGRTANTVARRTVLDRVLFQGNRAKQGGAAFVLNAAPLEITGTTFSGNVAVAAGGAQLMNSRLQILNSTFAGNEATLGVGGALMLQGNDPASSMRNATFADNRSSGGPGYFSAAIFGDMNFPVDNTVFANNLTNDGGSPMQCAFVTGFGTANLQWPVNHVAGGAPDTLCVGGIVFADPLLGPLGDHGGPTPTMVPAASSPLRGAGRNCPPTDQNGQPRNSAACTIGASE